MLKLLPQKKVKENWEIYKEEIRTAMVSTEGALAFVEGKTDETLKGIYGRIMNPFNTSMHLWIDNDHEYLLVTHIQICEFTNKKTLLLFSLTRTKDVDNSTILQRWIDGYPVMEKFAQENNCDGITAFTDLPYFTKIAKNLSQSSGVEIITRYQYYVPL
jgi:hypothetical protein